MYNAIPTEHSEMPHLLEITSEADPEGAENPDICSFSETLAIVGGFKGWHKKS